MLRSCAVMYPKWGTIAQMYHERVMHGLLLRGDSMLRTLRSDTKIKILNPNLDVKMFLKGVQTYLESIFSVRFVRNKKMLWLPLKTLKV